MMVSCCLGGRGPAGAGGRDRRGREATGAGVRQLSEASLASAAPARRCAGGTRKEPPASAAPGHRPIRSIPFGSDPGATRATGATRPGVGKPLPSASAGWLAPVSVVGSGRSGGMEGRPADDLHPLVIPGRSRQDGRHRGVQPPGGIRNRGRRPARRPARHGLLCAPPRLAGPPRPRRTRRICRRFRPLRPIGLAVMSSSTPRLASPPGCGPSAFPGPADARRMLGSLDRTGRGNAPRPTARGYPGRADGRAARRPGD
jgi:hypothetical protein